VNSGVARKARECSLSHLAGAVGWGAKAYEQNWATSSALNELSSRVLWAGPDGTRARQMAVPAQDQQTREWGSAAAGAHGDAAQQQNSAVSVWRLLAPSGGARVSEEERDHGGDAQDAAGSLSVVKER
jgi:hypothetical protein